MGYNAAYYRFPYFTQQLAVAAYGVLHNSGQFLPRHFVWGTLCKKKPFNHDSALHKRHIQLQKSQFALRHAITDDFGRTFSFSPNAARVSIFGKTAPRHKPYQGIAVGVYRIGGGGDGGLL